MNNEIEVQHISEYDLQNYLNMGYEFVCTITESNINMHSVQEEVPQYYMTATGGSSGGNYGYNQPSPVYKTKQYPVSEIHTRIVVKRTKAAKLLYEKSLKNENNG